MRSTPACLSWLLSHPPPHIFPAISVPAWGVMEHFAASSARENAPASDADLTFLCDYMSVGQQYSQYFASAEGRTRIASGGPSQTKQMGETLEKAAPSQFFPALRGVWLMDIMGKEALAPVLCNPALANALWTRVGGCCQYLHQQQQQQQKQAHAVASSKDSSTSTSGPSGSREGRGRSKNSASSSSGMGWAELDVPPDHRLLPVPGGQVAVMAQQKCIMKVRKKLVLAATPLVGEEEMKWSMRLLHTVIFHLSEQQAGVQGINASGLRPPSIGSSSSNTNSSSRSMVSSSSTQTSAISSSWPRVTAHHLQLLLEAIALTAAEGERAVRPENFLQSLNLFLLAGKVASKEERQAFLEARGKLLLQVLMLLGRTVDKGEIKGLRTALAYVLETCLEKGGPCWALDGQSKCCQVTSSHGLTNIGMHPKLSCSMERQMLDQTQLCCQIHTC